MVDRIGQCVFDHPIDVCLKTLDRTWRVHSEAEKFLEQSFDNGPKHGKTSLQK